MKKYILLFFVSMFFISQEIVALNTGEKEIELEVAIMLAKEELKSKVDFSHENYEIKADDSNSVWNNFIAEQPYVLELEEVKKLRLDKKIYWAIYFGPQKKGRCHFFGGDAFVFVERSTGNIIGVLLGK